MPSHYFAMLFRMKYIKRWALMRSTREENLSEHTLEVALIAHAIALISNRRLGTSLSADRVAVYALFHDTPEIITGDLPTPVKYYNDEIKSAYSAIEAEAKDSLLALLPPDLKDDYAAYYEPDDETRAIVRAADKIQALIKCREELGMGNPEFAAAEKSTRNAVRRLGLPAAEIFMDEFMESFLLTLDEQRPKK